MTEQIIDKDAERKQRTIILRCDNRDKFTSDDIDDFFIFVKKTILDSIKDKEDKASFNLSSKMGGFNYRCDIETHSEIDDNFIVPVKEGG